MNEEHVAVVRGGAEKIDEWRAQNPGVVLDLERANLTRAYLVNANLVNANLVDANLLKASVFQANLTGANLKSATLAGAAFASADLSCANLHGANLYQADLNRANLQGAILQAANLVGTNLYKVNLFETNTDELKLGHTRLIDIDIHEFVGRNMEHSGPSAIDHATMRKTRGGIGSEVEKFLIQCGLDQWEVEIARSYDPTLSPSEISDMLYKVFDKRTEGFFGGVFVSYAHQNSEFVDSLYSKLIDEKIGVYLDRHDFTAGSIEKNIDRAIRINDQVVLVLSEDALKSDWVWDEIATTLSKEKELDKDVLFPIALDDSWKTSPRNKRRLMTQIGDRVILDFSNPADFDTNLRKLITGMKVN